METLFSSPALRTAVLVYVGALAVQEVGSILSNLLMLVIFVL